MESTAAEKPKVWETTRESNLLRNIASGRYYARFKIAGKVKWINLDTDVWTVAKIRVADERGKIERTRQAADSVASGAATMGELVTIFKAGLAGRDLSEKTKKRYGELADFLVKTWPGFDKLAPDRVDRMTTEKWRDRVRREGSGFVPPGAKKASARVNGSSAGTINKAIDVLRLLLDVAVQRGQLGRNALTGRGLKLRADPKKVKLPDAPTLARLFAAMEAFGGNSKHAADLCRGIAVTGCRLNEAAELVRGDVDFAKGVTHIRGSKTDAADREVPMIPAARSLFERLLAKPGKDDEPVFKVSEATKTLTRGCKAVGIPRLTHHDLRDAFATAAIEAGVDIPTVAAWLGHADGGALLMRVYAHHRRPHSLTQAARVLVAV